ncbi:MAG: membrane integrity-associated transporter subunit PqiC [Rhodoferax sp.]|nr:membrane integrity-associated transporter subunit PqiC [Rhodoferax sp.]
MNSSLRLARRPGISWVLGAAVLLAGCSVLDKPTRATVFDFGASAVPVAQGQANAARVPVALADVEAPSAFDSTAVLYRLGFADAQQLQPYAQARWSMPPAQLLRQRLRQALSQQSTVMREGEVALLRPLVLRLEIDEFSQRFDAPDKSAGQVRVHATVTQASGTGERLVAQRDFVAERPAPSADAAGGVRALTAASDAVVADITQWMGGLP